MTNSGLWSRLCAVFALLPALIWVTPAWAHLNSRLEDGLAITHPRLVETLSQRASGEGIGLAYFMDPTGQSKPNLSNQYLAQLPLVKPIWAAVRKELATYAGAGKPGKTNGVGLNFHNRMFDMRFLEFDRARFSLVGVISRLDKGFMDPETCGETRLIYRLAYNVAVGGDESKTVMSRLPMTINLILHAKAPGSKITCQEIARRWQAFNVEGMSISAAVDKIMAADGPLAPELRDRSLLKQLEINMQLSRMAAANRPDFGGNAVYLLKVFKWNSTAQTFEESPMDNQIDRTKAQAFYQWLFDPQFKHQRLSELDRGVIQIPAEFLATNAFSTAPGALSRAINHVLAGTISDAEIANQLKDVRFAEMLNIKSVEGFKRRLTDITCTGCHQSRGVGGFHFVGQDPYRWNPNGTMVSLYPGNGVVVPGSGHFFADLERRRVVLNALAAGQAPGFSTGFASRPQEHVVGKTSDGHGAYNGWGAHCYNGEDPSFKRWTCAAGTRCEELHHSEMAPGMGVCVSNSGQELGEPTEAGDVKPAGQDWFSDIYVKTRSFPMPKGAQFILNPQSADAGKKTGGFPGGSLGLRSCDPGIMKDHPEAGCGSLPAGSGFNDCLFNKSKTFPQCMKEFTKPQGERGCSRENPCRDDYVCAESLVLGFEDKGVCVPPYFTFQFRVDGHPVSF